MTKLAIAGAVLAFALIPASAQARLIAEKVPATEQENVAGIRGSIPVAQAAEIKLGLIEARVKLWRDIQRYFSRKRDEPVFESSESFNCWRVSRWRARCSFSFETAEASYSGYGFVRKWPSGYWQGWWKARAY